MDVTWSTNDIFKEPFINIGNWELSKYSTFSHAKYVSADTETKLYVGNKLLTEHLAYCLYKRLGGMWCRKNIEVKPYAFMISDGDNFALFQNIEDFILCLAMLNVKMVFWYNTKFDFALFDNYFLRNNWTYVDEAISNKKHYGKLGDKTYQSLDGDFGQRYQMTIWKSYKNRQRHEKVHKFRMTDICNIYGGGLKKNLIDWKIQDKSGSEVRKLKMDYVHGSVETDLEYMIADTKGLHLLAERIDETLKEISGFSLFKGDFITAGGLAKKSLLKFMFKKEKPKDNIYSFKYFFPITTDEDLMFRRKNLYQGGKCLINPYKIGKVQHNIYKYDVNSMYPAQMRNMLYPIGKPKILDHIPTERDRNIYILHINHIFGTLKPNMIPVWYDYLTGEYVSNINELEDRYIWLDELEELTKWYDLDFNIIEVLEYKGRYCIGAQEYVDNFYKIKKESKGAIRNGAKLFLNSAYGKLAQRVERCKCHYELTEEGYIHLVKGEIEIDEKGMLSVIVGSRVTALARVSLMYYMRSICKNNPKKYFVYCDTDSVHALLPYDDIDAKELGKMKSEGVYENGLYIAPKTYILYNNIEENSKDYEVHTKGVNTEVVKNEILKCKDFNEVKEKFKAGVTYRCLTSLNVKGGKALIYIDKMLLNPKLDKTLYDDERIE